MKSLGIKEETVIPAMTFVQDNKKAVEVIDKILDMEDRGEELTAQKLLEIMATI